MSRNNKRRRREKAWKSRKSSKHRTLPKWLDVCEEAAELMAAGNWIDAREVLERYNAEHPGQPQVLRRLLEVYQEQRDYSGVCSVCSRLLDKDPDNRDLLLLLAGGLWANTQIALAAKTFRRFLARWPNDPMSDGAQDALEELETALDKLLRDRPGTREEEFELAALNEEMMSGLQNADAARTISIGERLLQSHPEFVPGMNNLSEAYCHEGRLDDAIAVARRALAVQPEDVYALANLTKYLFLSGQESEAREMAGRLRQAKSERDDAWVKKCEVFSYLGDDRAVLDGFAAAKRAGVTKAHLPQTALLFHLAAVASARLGDARKAREYWQAALSISPGLELALANLDDLSRPASERHGPWYFPAMYWGCRRVLGELLDAFEQSAETEDETATQHTARQFAEKHPELAVIVPALLDRGDEVGRIFAWQFAGRLATPDMHSALREFCLSQRGPDELRYAAALLLMHSGKLDPNGVRMSVNGQWRVVNLIDVEITTEATTTGRSPQVDDWTAEAVHALTLGDGPTAERILKKCLAQLGDQPDLLNNLAFAFSLEGRTDEAIALSRQIHERWPDYFFGRITLANLALAEGDDARAERFLEPLRKLTRLHVTEFEALAMASIRIFACRNELDKAHSWLLALRNVAPDHPALEELEHICRAEPPRSLIKRLLGSKA